jgi:hypothetical protein
MAQNGRITTGNIPRMLQYGLDKILDQMGKDYKGIGDKVFSEVKTDKAYYEMLQIAGMGIAGTKGEGEAITNWDSIDQNWVFRVPVQTVEKSARITREMIKDNVYENLLPRIAKEQLKALKHARDLSQANILNRAFTSGYTYGDGSVLCATNHAIQTGGTNSNRLAADQDLSEDSLEQMILLIDNFVNDDGLKSDYVPTRLVVPSALRFEAKRILNNTARPATADRDINVINMEGDISELVIWKRLTDPDAHFLQTDAEQGLITIRREGVFTMSAQDFETYDTKLTAAERYVNSAGDHRGIVGTPGA